MRIETAIVPPPEPPHSPEAWYAPDVHDQYELVTGVVATVRETDDAFSYEVRTPSLSARVESDLERVREHFDGVERSRPLTREGAVERLAAGFEPKYRQVIDRLVDCSPSGRRRLEYVALAELKCLDDLTPHALDDSIEVADVGEEDIVVHLSEYSPAHTGIETHRFVDRFAAVRLDRYTVSFLDYDVPVVRYREQVLGADPFETKYAVLEPDRLPGDRTLIEETKERIWETGFAIDSEEFTLENRTEIVRERARTHLSRRLTARNTRAWIETMRYRVQILLSEHGLSLPPVDRRFADDRLEDLVYYVLRDLVGHGQLTIPIRDPHLEDVEANRIGERVKVVPRGGNREPSNLQFDTEASFINVVTQLTADDGVELSASQPSAKVNVDPPGVDQTIRCAVALPAISEGGPHISIRKQAPDVLTPIDLVESGSLPTELVALLWMLYEHHGVVLFSGPTGAGKTTLMNAHMPFVDYADRPISIDEGSREVQLPHETGVSLSTRDHQDAYKRVSMADLMTETNYLNPDVQVIAEINTPASFETFGETLQTGHGVLGTTHAETVPKLVNRVIEQGLPSYLLSEIDLVVFPKYVGGRRYVGEVVELLSEQAADGLDGAHRIDRDGSSVVYNHVFQRDPGGDWSFAYDHPSFGDPTRSLGFRSFHAIADRTDRSLEAVEEEFHRKHDYVEYLVAQGTSSFADLFGFLSDLRTDEAATVDRLRREGI